MSRYTAIAIIITTTPIIRKGVGTDLAASAALSAFDAALKTNTLAMMGAM